MSEKHLTEQPWKALVAKTKIKDTGLQKALASFAKTDPTKDAKSATGSLADVIDHAGRIKKANPTLKEVTSYLDEVVKEANKARQAIASQAKAAAAEDDDTADIKTRLIIALNKVKSSEGGDGLPFVACVAKPVFGILICKSPSDKVGPAHKKTLTDLTQGTKFITGRCIFEKDAHTFIVDPVPAGLPKFLKAALKQFTEKTYKVRVRDSEGKVVADSESEGDATAQPTAQPNNGAAAPKASAPSPSAPTDKSASSPEAPIAGEVKAGPAPATPPTGAPAATPAAASAKKKIPDPKPTGNAELDKFNQEATDVERLILDLEANLQFEHIEGEITAAREFLRQAREAAKTPDYAKAEEKLKEATKKCDEGNSFAAKYAAFIEKLAGGATFVTLMTGMNKWWTDYMKDRATELKDAQDRAKPPTRDYAGATADVENTIQTISNELKATYVTGPKADIDALKAKPALSFVATEEREIDSAYAEVLAAHSAGNWGAVVLGGKTVYGTLETANKLADRRQLFDNQRTTTMAALDALRPHVVFALKLADLGTKVAEADNLASRDVMQIEDGAEELKKIEARCEEMAKVASDADAYLSERAGAMEKFEPLQYNPQSPKLGDLFYGIMPQFERASKFTDEDNWKAAREVIGRVKADIEQATQLAAKAKELEAAGNTSAETAAIMEAAGKLRKEIEAAQSGDDAKIVRSELKQAQDNVKKAESLADRKPEKAAALIKETAALLTTAASVRQQHARFATRLKAVETRLEKVNKLPTAKANKEKLKPVEKLIKQAAGFDDSRAWDNAMPTLDRAEDGVAEAEKFDGLRTKYEARQKEVQLALDGVAADALDRKKRKQFEADLKAAEKQAEKLQFDAALRALDQVEAKLESINTDRLARQVPADLVALTASAKKVMGKGGGAVIDQLVKNLPDNDAGYDALAALAKERFGVEFKSDADTMMGSGKAIWAMMAKVPEDVVNNPSLKLIERELPNKNGGYYSAGSDKIGMHGRPAQHFYGFGNLIADQLPKDVEADCKPVSDKAVDYLDFATLHEVGHSVDDNLNFMDSRMGDATYGGWKVYGGKVGPIVEAVAAEFGFNESAEQKNYIRDLILRNRATPPTPPSGKEEAWQVAQENVDFWYSTASNMQIWWSQQQSQAVAIKGVVYHEAYKNNWISYNLSARRQAISGYQFRAPGEWFAELYASYRIGKLKNTHPAVKWLSKLKI